MTFWIIAGLIFWLLATAVIWSICKVGGDADERAGYK